MIQKIMTNKAVVILSAIFCCALWGISTPIVKTGYAYLDPSHVPSLLLWVGFEFLIAGFFTVGGYSVVSKRLVYPKKENVKGVILVSLLQTVLQYSFMYVGLSFTTSVKGAILKSTDVFFVVLIASLIFKLEKLTVQKLIACIIGFLGIIVMNLNGLSLQIAPLGDGLVILSVIAYAFSVIMIKLFAKNEDPIVLSGYQMAVGGTVLLILGASTGGKLAFWGILPVSLCLALIYAVSYTLWTVLLKHNSASSISIYSFMIPIFGVIFSALLLSEDSGVEMSSLAAALVLVCLGIILWGYEKKPKTK